MSLKDWEHKSICTLAKLEPGDLKCSVKLLRDSGKCCRLVECVETAFPAPSWRTVSPLCVRLGWQDPGDERVGFL